MKLKSIIAGVLSLVLSSSRGALDVLVQALGPTNANGVARGSIRSSVAGITAITAIATLGNVELNDHPSVTFTRGATCFEACK